MKITVVGSYGVGMTMRVPRVPYAGETLSGGEFAAGPGGKGSNQAIGAARLGADVTLLTAIGDDGFGNDAFELWRAEGVNAEHVVVESDASTMVGIILVEQDGENRIVIASGALDRFTPEHIREREDAITSADLVVVSLEIPSETAIEALMIAKRAGVRTLLNPAPASPLPDSVWPAIDVLTPNQTEAKILLGLDPSTQATPLELATLLQQKTSGTVILTAGGEGAVVVRPSQDLTIEAAAETEWIRAFTPAAVVDTTGAGDTFTAALSVALTEGTPVLGAARYAAAAGAFSISREGVIPGLPSHDDILTVLAQQPLAASSH